MTFIISSKFYKFKSYHLIFHMYTSYQDGMCHCNYAEHVVTSYNSQIQSKYYEANMYAYIGVIELECFIALQHTIPLS